MAMIMPEPCGEGNLDDTQPGARPPPGGSPSAPIATVKWYEGEYKNVVWGSPCNQREIYPEESYAPAFPSSTSFSTRPAEARHSFRMSKPALAPVCMATGTPPP